MTVHNEAEDYKQEWIRVAREAGRKGDYSLLHFLAKRLKPVEQVAFVNNLYEIIGHHDHMEVEAVLASSEQLAKAYIKTVRGK